MSVLSLQDWKWGDLIAGRVVSVGNSLVFNHVTPPICAHARKEGEENYYMKLDSNHSLKTSVNVTIVILLKDVNSSQTR